MSMQKTTDLVSAGAAGAAVTGLLGQVSLWLAVIASALSITWFIVRLYDRFKHGPPKE